MSKAQQIDDTMELDDILSQPVKDKERMAAFLMRKLAENKPSQNNNLFGNFKVDFELDFEVPLIKKSKPKAAEVQPLRELTSPSSSASGQANKPPVEQAPNENQPPVGSPPLSPNHRRSLRRSGNVPGSDKLRRHAIRRRSRSCGRQLLPEFEDAINITRSLSSPVNFMPEISSTPCAEKTNEKAAELKGKAGEPAEKQTEIPSENPAEKTVPKPTEEPPLPEVESTARTSLLAAEIAEICKEKQSSFHRNVLQLDYTGRGPSRPQTPPSPSVALRRTYTMQKGPSPGQLLLSPSLRSYTPVKLPVIKGNQIKQQIVVPDTPQRPSYEPAWQSQPQPDFVVPETQPQGLEELVQTLSRNASGPIVVINTSNPNLSARKNSFQVESVPASPVAQASPVAPALSVAPTSPVASTSSIRAASFANRSAAASPNPNAPRVVENLDAIMTDDDSDEQPSTVALNLAPPGGNTTRQRRLHSKNRNRVNAELQESSMRLLNLHRSVSANAKKSKSRMTKVPLNKAPSAPINGEQFATELTRMSNYEILDLRKRNSLNEVFPLDGHRKRCSEEKLILEKKIQREMERRNLMDEADGLPGKPPSDDSDSLSGKPSSDDSDYLPASRKTRSRGKSKERPNGRSRSRRRGLPMTTELKNYLGLSNTMEIRRKLSREGKRSLYTKGDSNVEDYDSSSPVKLPRLSRSIQIVPPPPASLRYSQSLQNLRRGRKFDFDDVVMSAPPDFHDEPNSDTIEIAPPPPEYVANTRVRSTNGRKSNKDDLVPPPQEFERHEVQSEEDEQLTRSQYRTKPSLKTNSTRRKTRDNEVVPPPQEFERHEVQSEEDEQITRSRNKTKPSLKTNSTRRKTRDNEVVPPSQEFERHEVQSEEDEQITMSHNRTKPSLQSNWTGRKTRDNEVVPPPQEFERHEVQSEEDEQITRSRNKTKPSLQSNSTGRKTRDNEVVLPPQEFERHEVQSEEDEQITRSHNKTKPSLQSNSTGRKTRDNEVVPAPVEYVEPAEYNENEERNFNEKKQRSSQCRGNESEQSNLPGQETKEDTPPLEYTEPLENNEDDSPIKQPRSQSKGKKSKRPKPKEQVDPPPLEYNETSDRLSSSKNPSNGHRYTAADEENTATLSNYSKSEHMESLRVNTPTPPLIAKERDMPSTNRFAMEASLADVVPSANQPAMEASSADDVPSANRPAMEASLADDVPSTSRAALEALQRSQQESKSQPKNLSNGDLVFKKPTARAPRAKKAKKTEVDKLRLRTIPVVMDEDDHNTSGIRRSKRGQMPLQMTFCHTMDPRSFSFMSDFVNPFGHISKIKKGSAKKTTKSKPTVRQDSMVNQEPTVSLEPSLNRGPLCSSTPRNPETGPEAMPTSESLGISPLTWEDTPVQAVVEKVHKKRGRKKKQVQVVQTETESEPEPIAAMVSPIRNEQEMPIVSSVTPARNEQEEASIQLMHWLRGVPDAQPAGSMPEENASVSTANDLIFTKVDNIDYAFYNTKDKASLGYMRFQPHQTRNKKRAKVHPLKFVVQFGEFAVQTLVPGEEEETEAVLRVGDMIEIDKGTKYSIQNAIDSVSVLMVIRS